MKSEELLTLKNDLLAACSKYIKGRIKTIQKAIQNAQSSANEEVKSSAGDKYETGRAMMHLETENNSIQLSQALDVEKALQQITVNTVTDKIRLGSMVFTSGGDYFISISAGAITIDKKQYFAISPSSPIGQLLINKSVGDSVSFNGRTIDINAVY
ncbi:MAG: hypothetical protein AAFN93_25130 [Bacteroidota bacterium]